MPAAIWDGGTLNRDPHRDDFGLHRSLSRNRPNGKLGIINIRLEA